MLRDWRHSHTRSSHSCAPNDMRITLNAVLPGSALVLDLVGKCPGRERGRPEPRPPTASQSKHVIKRPGSGKYGVEDASCPKNDRKPWRTPNSAGRRHGQSNSIDTENRLGFAPSVIRVASRGALESKRFRRRRNFPGRIQSRPRNSQGSR